MAQHEEPMDIDSSVCDFDDKENSLHHNNVLPRTPCTEKGYEELDVSELNMKLRYSITPSSTPMSKSYTANCLDNKTFDSGNVDNDNNLTRSMNSALKNDVRSQMTLPLQSLPAEQGQVDTNRNALRPLDSTATLGNVVLTVSTPNDIDENISLPSSSSSIVNTPEATTPNKEESKDGGSPIMRGLKTVFNMFRPSQSPIPPEEETHSIKSELSPPIIASPNNVAEKSQAVLASTPLTGAKTKDSLTKRTTPNRDSLVFNEDLEKELQWKDETTIIFSNEKIPIHKLFFPTAKPLAKENEKIESDNLDNTVEYMDVSYNESVNKTLEIKTETVFDKSGLESDGEFVDCESTFTKSQSQCDLSFKSQETLNKASEPFDGNVSTADNATKETLNVSMSVKSDEISIVSTDTAKGNTTFENIPSAGGVVQTNEVHGLDNIPVESKVSLPVELDVIQGPDLVSNSSVNLSQTNVNDLQESSKDFNAQLVSNHENNFAISNDEIVNDSVGVSSLSQIPLICDPRVLLFNVSSADNSSNCALPDNTVANENLDTALDTTPANIPLPDDEEMEKLEYLDDTICVKVDNNEQFIEQQTDINMETPLSTLEPNKETSEGEIVSSIVIGQENIQDQVAKGVEPILSSKIGPEDIQDQVAKEVNKITEPTIEAAETREPDTTIDIDVANITCNLNETNYILNAIENVSNEISTHANITTTDAENVEHESNYVIEELQKTIEKLEGKGENSMTQSPDTVVETSLVTANKTENATILNESGSKPLPMSGKEPVVASDIEENLEQNQVNLKSTDPDQLTVGDFKLAKENIPEVPPVTNESPDAPNVDENKALDLLSPKATVKEKKQEAQQETLVGTTQDTILFGNVNEKQNYIPVSERDSTGGLGEPMDTGSVKDINTEEIEIIGATNSVVECVNANDIGPVVAAGTIRNLHQDVKQIATTDDEIKSSNEQRSPNLDQITVHLQPTELNEMQIAVTDEEIVASENNSPFVSVTAEFENLQEDKPVEVFEQIDIPVETNEELRKSPLSSLKDKPVETNKELRIPPPGSPKIVSKGYNFNFDEIDDPFATKTKIRQSPPPTPNQSLEQHNDTGIDKRPSPKKDFNKDRRKSQPLRKKQPSTNKKLNATFSGPVQNTDEKIFIDPFKELDPVQTEAVNSHCENKIISDQFEVLETTNKTQNENQTPVNPTQKNIETEVISVVEKHVDEAQDELKSTETVTSTTEVINNISTSEQSAFNSAGTSSTEGREPKNQYNIPEISDTDFNPFTSKSKVRMSPPPGLENPFETKSKQQGSPDNSLHITRDLDFNGSTKSPREEERDSSNSLNNITTSSKNTEKVNTEDEDTIEGPFLEAEDFGIDNKVSETENNLVKNKHLLDMSDIHDDMMPFCELPPTDAGNADAGEMFIDADAFEFLLNQHQTNTVVDNGKESLFLKFDPLFAKRVSSDGVVSALKNIQKKQSTPKKLMFAQNDATFTAKSPAPGPSSLNITQDMDTHDTTEESMEDLNVTVAKPMMVVNPAVNPVAIPRAKPVTPVATNRRSLTFTSPAIAVIDRLLSLSANNSAIAHEDTISEVPRDHSEADVALTQLRELLADKEINVYTLRSESKELKDRLANMESQVKSLEAISEERLAKINDLTAKLDEKTIINKSMAKVVEEYERTIACLISDKEQDKIKHAEERAQLIRERDEQTAHLASMEVSFSDLHSKYEKSKQIILGFKSNEEMYKKSIKDFEDNLSKMQKNYELLKQHATSKLNHANEELQKINRAHEAEVLKLNAMIKRKELHITSLEETVSQKTKANEELTAICDELINKVSSR